MVNFCHHCGTASHSTTKGEERKTARKAYEPKKKPRKISAKNIAYGKAFKKVQHRFKKKGGGWKKDGFKRAGAAARKAIK